MKIFRLLFISALIAFVLYSCRKDLLTTDASDKLEFSRDTVIFDTVFTTIGSTTKRLLIYNPSDKRIIISSIQLANGSASKFRLNVDGIPGIAHHDIEIQGKDSMFLFVEVTLDASGQNNPLIVTDSILFMTNGNLQDVDLVAWGQDAYFYYPTNYHPYYGSYSIICNEVWTNDKPHVIYGLAVIDSACSLDIMEGTNVYLHKNSSIMAYKDGILRVNGQQGNPVTFQGDRLEPFYHNVPGQWGGIWFFNKSKNNKIDHAIIKNGTIGIEADNNDGINPNVTITNTQVYQMSGLCIIGYNAIIKAENSVFANGGQYCGAFVLGGDYDFRHCTFADYYQYGNRQTPSVILTNYQDSFGTIIPIDLDAYFGNCIIIGNLENEIGFDNVPGAAFNYMFDHSLLRIDPEVNTANGVNYNNIIKTEKDTFFVDPINNNFHLDASSLAIGAGSFSIMLSSPTLITDLDGIGRKLDPDMGAYESRD